MFLFAEWTLCLVILVSGVSTLSSDFVLLGSTGDLARKYLFRSLSDIILSRPDLHLRVFATARNPTIDLDHILAQSMPSVDDTFRKSIIYKQLKTVNHYQALCDSLGNDTAVVVFYLAIPPFAYVSSIQMISLGCQHLLLAGKVRIVIEKPFGSNYTSALSMSDKIAKYVKDDFIYRIDHYLGKGIVREILKFR